MFCHCLFFFTKQIFEHRATYMGKRFISKINKGNEREQRMLILAVDSNVDCINNQRLHLCGCVSRAVRVASTNNSFMLLITR